MADPTLQTFCCHHTNHSDRAITIMQEFNTDAYNTVCMISSAMGMLGAVYQILPRADANISHSWRSFSRGRDIIVWLAVADLLASLGLVCYCNLPITLSVFVRSALWRNFKSIIPMEGDVLSIIFCAVSSAWTQYFYMATWIWTLCYAVDMKLLLGDKNGHPRYYHTLAWILPAVFTSLGLIILYIPNANCHSLTSLSSAIVRILPNYCITYVVLTVVMIANPILYVASTRDLQTAVQYSMAQVTGRERRLIQTIRLKFALINVVYYVCWMPNLINGILLWTLWFKLPIKSIITLWYIMAVTNPLQAFFNAIVYQSWTRREKIHLKCCQDFTTSTNTRLNAISKRGMQPSESSPLLNPQIKYGKKIPHISINGSSSL